jgi:hypothetical protein
MKTSSKISTMPRSELAQLLQPGRVGFPVKGAAGTTLHQRRVGWSSGVRVQGLQRVHQHTGDVPAAAQHAQASLAHIFESECVVFVYRVTDAWLHLAPPAVIGTAEAHQKAALGVVACQAYGLHHCFGSRHVEGDLVHPRDFAQLVDVARGYWMIRPKHRSQIAHARTAALDAFLVEVVAENVDPVGAGQVVPLVAVQIGGGRAAGGDDKGPGAEVPAHETAELEGHAIARCELEIGDFVLHFLGLADRLGEALRVKGGQAPEGCVALFGNVLRGSVRPEEVRLVVFVEGYEPGQAAAHLGVAGQRAMLGARELQA